MIERETRLWWRDALMAWIATGVIMGGGLLLRGAPPSTRILGTTACAGLAIVWGFWFAIRILRRADEFHLEASKFAWHWGGLAGVAVSAPIYVFVAVDGLHWIDPSTPTSKALGVAFGMGYGLLLVAQLVGFVAVNIWWKATRR